MAIEGVKKGESKGRDNIWNATIMTDENERHHSKNIKDIMDIIKNRDTIRKIKNKDTFQAETKNIFMKSSFLMY